jgi:hypothetical protein
MKPEVISTFSDASETMLRDMNRDRPRNDSFVSAIARDLVKLMQETGQKVPDWLLALPELAGGGVGGGAASGGRKDAGLREALDVRDPPQLNLVSMKDLTLAHRLFHCYFVDFDARFFNSKCVSEAFVDLLRSTYAFSYCIFFCTQNSALC